MSWIGNFVNAERLERHEAALLCWVDELSGEQRQWVLDLMATVKLLQNPKPAEFFYFGDD